ncbi:hypothetical protein M0R45_010769 [Rubus argutus]|uniref:KIB1-4 beta-propeller domain-containing protein n=1 Tax=Rubus argutus TaxID=59490 RepID=A0AAW1Y8B1_RUBAR
MDADWSDLPPDLVVSIAKRIVYLDDFAAFGAACKSWRSKATKENFTGESTPILMLPMNEDDVNPRCYSLTKGRFNKLNLPEAKGSHCYSSLGWLLIASDAASKLTLLHPLNHTRIELPGRLGKRSYKTTYKYPTYGSNFIRKFVLSSSPSQSLDYMVMVINNMNHLAFCRPRKDENWASILVGSNFKDTIMTTPAGEAVMVCGSDKVDGIVDGDHSGLGSWVWVDGGGDVSWKQGRRRRCEERRLMAGLFEFAPLGARPVMMDLGLFTVALEGNGEDGLVKLHGFWFWEAEAELNFGLNWLLFWGRGLLDLDDLWVRWFMVVMGDGLGWPRWFGLYGGESYD